MNSTKRLWEIKPSTICKVLGTAFDNKDVNSIAKRFKLKNHNDLVDDELAFHSAFVEYCQTENPLSRYIEKTLKRKYEAYSSKLTELDPLVILQTLRRNPENLSVPLWAALWGVATSDGGAKYEPAFFGFVHLLEHRLVREYWKDLTSSNYNVPVSKQKSEAVLELKKSVLATKRELDKLKKTNFRLQQKLILNEAQAGPLKTVDLTAPHTSCSCNCNNKQKIVELRQMLEEERNRSKSFQGEITLFRNEIDGLMAELADLSRQQNENTCGVPKTTCPISSFLNGMSVAMVGGLDSLEAHYKKLIESMGGKFHRHDGYCRNGDDALEDVIGKANLVVCPIEVNSHNAARSAKRICKARGIPCCFVKSASLATLKRTIEKSAQEAAA